MAEIALGVLGVSGLFSATLDVWSFVDAGRDYALSFTRLRTRLDLQRTLFVNWGKSVGFGSEEGYHPQLDDPGVRQVLAEIYLILSETDNLAFKYGVRMLEESEERRPVAIPRRILSLGRSASIFRPRYEEFCLLFRRHAQGSNTSGTRTPQAHGVRLAATQKMVAVRERQRNSSIWAKARWAIRDESKMERLVCDLAELVSGLRALTTDIVDDERERQIAEQTVSDIDSVDSLRQIQEASLEASPLEASPLSMSVSERIRSLESGGSGATAFFSTRSRLSKGALDNSVYGTSRPSQGSFFPKSVFSDHMYGSTLESAPSGNLERRLETVDEADAFAIDEYPTPSVAVYHLGHRLAHLWETEGTTTSPHPTRLPVEPDGRPFEMMLVSGPADTPYSGGQFRAQVWLGMKERAEMDGKEVTVCYIYVRFLTRICHPLVDTDGYVHGRFFTAPFPEVGMFLDHLHHLSDMIGRMLRYCHWTGIDTAFDAEADCIERLESTAHSLTEAYAKPVFSQSPLVAGREFTSGDLPLVHYPSRMKLERRVWEAQGVEGMSIALLGYPAVQTWEGQLMPEVRLSAKDDNSEEVPLEVDVVQ